MITIPFFFMIERINNFQLLFRYHAIIERLRGDPHPKLLLLSRSKENAARQGKGLGVFPSSFNPVTNGHMAILQRAAEIKAFKEILVVLDIHAMDKEILGATLVDRLLMVHGLFEDYPHFSVGVSNRGLFLAKAEVLKGIYPGETDITFIVGYDTMKRVFDPKYYEDREGALDQLFGSCAFMVANRDDKGKKALQQLMASSANRRFKGKVHFFEIPNRLARISSSHVRQRVMEGKSFARLVPPKIGECIKEMTLYKKDREVGPQGQRINRYAVRIQVLNRLYDMYPEGKVEIDIVQIVDSVVEGMRKGQDLETLLDTIPEHVVVPRVGKSRRRQKDDSDDKLNMKPNML